MHPAIANSFEPPFDVYARAWEWVFRSEAFISWLEEGRTWQLRCVGPPGSGKTTLSALVVEQLRKEFRDANIAVASIFIIDDLGGREEAFLEEFLESVLKQLSESAADSDFSCCICSSYAEACKRNEKFALRIEMLRKAIYTRLTTLNRAFLIVDDFDRCSAEAAAFLEDELARLQRHSVKIMVTSRVPYHRVANQFLCEVELDENEIDLEHGGNLSVYWQCERCSGLWMSEEDEYNICNQCKLRGYTCRTCGPDARLFEPYTHVELPVLLSNRDMECFLKWNLEGEHGDLGLQSANQHKPPPSALGRALREERVAENIVQAVVFESEGNIAIARTRLDEIHVAQTIQETEPIPDRLSRNRIAMFQAGISRINEQADGRRELGLTAISAAGSESGGTSFRELKEQLRTIVRKRKSDGASDLTLYEALHAAAGYLVVDNTIEQRVTPYHTSFFLFVNENYDERLFLKGMDLGYARPSRSKTLQF
ncbi:hypothetical protein NA57DRAFT_80750 [Rhizodiscina lignyota]|uniref:Nephrocystin 3-like N-terminal domain-containing protein n=1 Tax=Rhizodiscina lignyota TaxID=1504668 RepID=A0A9P4I825_9PEZI|nr:hypothetical protein NA57DRAFT_80750 [Rhizodiscina lignyota]